MRRRSARGVLSMPDVLIPGTQLITREVFVYRCPTCAKTFRYDDPYAPLCTGPSEMRDDHPPQLMDLIRREEPRPCVVIS